MPTLVVTGGRLGDIYGTKMLHRRRARLQPSPRLWCGLRNPVRNSFSRGGAGRDPALMVPRCLPPFTAVLSTLAWPGLRHLRLGAGPCRCGRLPARGVAVRSDLAGLAGRRGVLSSRAAWCHLIAATLRSCDGSSRAFTCSIFPLRICAVPGLLCLIGRGYCSA